MLDSGEPTAVTASNGSFVFDNVTPGNDIWVDVAIGNEGTPDALYSMTSPALGHRVVSIGAGGTVIGVTFGLANRANMDWGDLPASYDTNAENPDGPGPSHVVVPWFRLGSNIDGEVAGIPTADATGDDTTGGSNNGPDDGVIIENNGGRLVVGDNTLHVTVFGVGGLLTGWMDFNNDGHFD